MASFYSERAPTDCSHTSLLVIAKLIKLVEKTQLPDPGRRQLYRPFTARFLLDWCVPQQRVGKTCPGEVANTASYLGSSG